MGFGNLSVPKFSKDLWGFESIWANGLRKGNSIPCVVCAMALGRNAVGSRQLRIRFVCLRFQRLRLSVHGHILLDIGLWMCFSMEMLDLYSIGLTSLKISKLKF